MMSTSKTLWLDETDTSNYDENARDINVREHLKITMLAGKNFKNFGIFVILKADGASFFNVGFIQTSRTECEARESINNLGIRTFRKLVSSLRIGPAPVSLSTVGNYKETQYG